MKANNLIAPILESTSTGRLEICELDTSYLPQICSLEKLCYSNPWSDSLIAGEFKKNVSVRLGLLEDKNLRGYSFSYIVGDELHLLNLAICPNHRSQGLGKMLLTALLAHSFSLGVRYVALEVRRSNLIAQSLYKSLGFNLSGERKHYYRDNQEDALVLERELEHAPNLNFVSKIGEFNASSPKSQQFSRV